MSQGFRFDCSYVWQVYEDEDVRVEESADQKVWKYTAPDHNVAVAFDIDEHVVLVKKTTPKGTDPSFGQPQWVIRLAPDVTYAPLVTGKGRSLVPDYDDPKAYGILPFDVKEPGTTVILLSKLPSAGPIPGSQSKA
jgi:hypothetical protein